MIKIKIVDNTLTNKYAKLTNPFKWSNVFNIPNCYIRTYVCIYVLKNPTVKDLYGFVKHILSSINVYKVNNIYDPT